MSHNKRVSVTQDFYKLHVVSTPDYCGRKNLLAYELAHADQAAGRDVQQVVLKDLASGASRFVTAGGLGEYNPRFSPDGERLAFISDVSGDRQVWVADLHSGAVTQLTTMRFGVSDPVWSPNGDKIAFLSACAAGEDPALLQVVRTPEEKAAFVYERSRQPVVIEDYGYKNEDAMGFAPKETNHLWVVDLNDKKVMRLSDGDRDHVMPAWAPDGKSIAFISNRARPREESIGMDLFLVSAEGGEIKRLTEELWVVYYPVSVRPVFSADGKYIIAGCLAPSLCAGIPPAHLYRVPVDGGKPESIFPQEAPCHEATAFPYNANGGTCYETVQIGSDGTSVYFLSGVDGETNIYRANLLDEPGVVAYATGKQIYRGIGKPQNGKMVILKGSPCQAPEIYLADEATAAMQQITFSNPFLDEVALAQPEELWVKTLDGESRVQGWVLPPQNRQPGKKYPAVLYIHGGPHPYYSYGLTYEHQALAGAGIGVIYCNPRGSSGYGPTHQNMERAFDGSAYYDLLQFMDEAIRTFDWIDGDHLGVTGGSYGGYMTNYMVTHSQRFKAAVTQRSIANFLISYASSDMAGSSKEHESFSAFMTEEIKRSPVAYADRINIPFLILHSTGDMRCPVEEAHQMFVAVKDTHPDLPVRLVLFPKSNHSLLSEGPMHLRVAHYDEMINWFVKYLG